MKGINRLEDTGHKGNPYEDMLFLPHHISPKRPQMPMENRAAQFSPFAALTGFEEAIQETARVTEGRRELDENVKEEMNQKLQELSVCLYSRPQVKIIFFQQDLKKDGGKYVELTGIIKKIDVYRQRILMEDGTSIGIEDLISLE